MCSLARIIVKLLDWNMNYAIDSEDSHEDRPRQRRSINNDGISGNKGERSPQIESHPRLVSACLCPSKHRFSLYLGKARTV
jgi:hypothetical protein